MQQIKTHLLKPKNFNGTLIQNVGKFNLNFPKAPQRNISKILHEFLLPRLHFYIHILMYETEILLFVQYYVAFSIIINLKYFLRNIGKKKELKKTARPSSSFFSKDI